VTIPRGIPLVCDASIIRSLHNPTSFDATSVTLGNCGDNGGNTVDVNNGPLGVNTVGGSRVLMVLPYSLLSYVISVW
jgi:hypothetical protein